MFRAVFILAMIFLVIHCLGGDLRKIITLLAMFIVWGCAAVAGNLLLFFVMIPVTGLYTINSKPLESVYEYLEDDDKPSDLL